MALEILRLLRRVALALVLTGVASLLSLTVLWYHYYDTLPRSPEPATGKIYVMNMHGVAVYATRTQRHRLDFMENLSFILLFAGIVGATLTDPDYRQRMGWQNPEEPPRWRGRSDPPHPDQ